MPGPSAMDDEETTPGRPQAVDPVIGRRIADRYTIRSRIDGGEGGPVAVYLATQDALQRKVVIKAIRPDASDTQAEVRFKREAQALSRLTHPNIVAVYDYGLDPGTGLLFLAMEWVSGVTLTRYQTKRGAASVAELAPIATQLLQGMSEVHRRGLVHGALTPANVMLASLDGESVRVKLLDFGLTSSAADPEVAAGPYEAPEVARGAAPDPRSDVYALGVILYQLLAGALPTGADGRIVPLAERRSGSDLPPPLAELIQACLAPDPAQRPADAPALLAGVEAVLGATAVGPSGVQHVASVILESRVTNDPSSLRQNEPASVASERTARVGMYAGLATGLLGIGALVVVVILLAGLLMSGGLTGGDPVTAPRAMVAEDVDQVMTFRKEGLAALSAKDYERAVTMFQVAVEKAPENSDIKDLLRMALEMRETAAAAAVAPPPAPPAPVVAQVDEPEDEPEPKKPAQDRKPPPKQPSKPPPRTPEPAPPKVVEEAPAMGAAVITSLPKGLRFEIQGVAEGATPASLATLPVGSHTVQFFHEGKVVHTGRIDVKPGGLELLDVDLQDAVAPPKAPEPAPVQPVAPDTQPGTASIAPPVVPDPVPPTPAPSGSPDAVVGSLFVESPNAPGEVWANGKKCGPMAPVVCKDLPVGPVTVEIKVGKNVVRTTTAVVEADTRVKVVVR